MKNVVNKDQGEISRGRKLNPHLKIMHSNIPRACCECGKVETASWSMLAGPITILKLGLQNMRACLDSEDAQLDAATQLDCCERAIAALQVAYAQMSEKKQAQGTPGQVDLNSFMDQAMCWFAVRAQRSDCTLMLEDSTPLPYAKIDSKCLWCFFNRFFNIALDIGANGEPWKLKLSGSSENCFAYIHVKAQHPKSDRFLREAWDRLEKRKSIACQIPIKVDSAHGRGQEVLSLRIPVLANERLLIRD